MADHIAFWQTIVLSLIQQGRPMSQALIEADKAFQHLNTKTAVGGIQGVA